MNRIKPFLVATLVLACAGCTQPPPPPPVDTKPRDLADIKALEDRFSAAVKAKDVNAIMAVYLPGETLRVFDVTPPREYVGEQAYRKDWEETMALYPGPLEFSLTDLDITVGGGEVAYGHSVQRMAGTLKSGKKFDYTFRVTDGYRKVGGKWLIAHEHVSVPVDLDTLKPDVTSKP